MAILKKDTKKKKNTTKGRLRDVYPLQEQLMDAQELAGERLELIKKGQEKLDKSEEENRYLRGELTKAREYNDRVARRDLMADEPYVVTPHNLNQEQFHTGAVRRKTQPCRLDLIPLEALEAMGDRIYLGVTVRGYGERNWEKGIDYANLIQHALTHTSKFAAQVIHNPTFNLAGSLDRNQTQSSDGLIEEEDSPYGNACAALWNWMAIVTFLRRGNPAERKS